MCPLYILLKSNINLESLVIACVGYLIVFTALVLLFWFFNMIPRIIITHMTRRTHMGFARKMLKKKLPRELWDKTTFLMSRQHIPNDSDT